MCVIVPGFSTVVGTGAALSELRGVWSELEVTRRYDLPEPRIVNFADLDHAFEDPNAPGVARVWHEWVDGNVANLIQVEAALRGLSVICEPAHELTLATGGGHGAGGQRPNVTIDPNVAARAVSSQLPPTAAGRKVAVLDTGDLSGSRPTMVDFLKGQPDDQAISDDLHGHGTAVAQLLREVNPNADVYIVRVVQNDLTSTYELLCGLTYVMWPGLYDVVSVSLTQKMPGGCATMLGASLDMVLEICRRYGKSVPTLVAAAGNSTSGHGFTYPAKLSGAVVVQAWDWQQNSAGYNVTLPPTVQPAFASGGDGRQPFGTITRVGRQPEKLFGTSFAAAVVAAHILP
jgi:hypothetical protein